jgi:hypothetical protein
MSPDERLEYARDHQNPPRDMFGNVVTPTTRVHQLANRQNVRTAVSCGCAPPLTVGPCGCGPKYCHNGEPVFPERDDQAGNAVLGKLTDLKVEIRVRSMLLSDCDEARDLLREDLLRVKILRAAGIQECGQCGGSGTAYQNLSDYVEGVKGRKICGFCVGTGTEELSDPTNPF